MIWILFISLLVATSTLFGFSVEEALDSVSFKEKSYMRFFVKKVIFFNQASHVIAFPNKPICITTFKLQGQNRTYDDILAYKGWYLFKKKEHLFPHPMFHFEEHIRENNGPLGYSKVMSIIIINKQSLINCMNNHLGVGPRLFSTIIDSRR